MRTRRSWRNQNRLFRELFAPPQRSKPTLDERIALLEQSIARCGNRRTRRQLERDLKSLQMKAARRQRAKSAGSPTFVTQCNGHKATAAVLPEGHPCDDRRLDNIQAALRLCLAEIEQFHHTAYPDCTGGCPAHEAMHAARSVLS